MTRQPFRKRPSVLDGATLLLRTVASKRPQNSAALGVAVTRIGTMAAHPLWRMARRVQHGLGASEVTQEGVTDGVNPTSPTQNTAVCGGEVSRRGTGPVELRPVPAESDADRRWLKNWQANEMRWLASRNDELERQLRRRTIVLGGALALSAFLAIVAASAFALSALSRPEPPVTGLEAAPPGAAAAESPAAAVGAGWALEIGPARGQQAGTAVPLDDSGGAGELEVVQALYDAEIAELRGELETARAEVEALGEQLESSWQEIETLEALLATATGGIVRLNTLLAAASGGNAPADEGSEANRRGREPDAAQAWPR